MNVINMGMRALKLHCYETNTQETVEITDIEYGKLTHLAKEWNVTIQDVFRIIITNGLRAKEPGI